MAKPIILFLVVLSTSSLSFFLGSNAAKTDAIHQIPAVVPEASWGPGGFGCGGNYGLIHTDGSLTGP